jgi:hypothetical protein
MMCPSEELTLSEVEVIVYLVISPSSGPEYRLFAEEDILAAGGVHAVERELESDSYWFIRLGVIKGKLDRKGLTFDNSAFARLPEPSEKAWKTGWLNPTCGKSEVEKVAFKMAFDAIERMLDSWKRREDGTVDAYTLKELKIGSQKLASLSSGLSNGIKKLHEVLEITVIKFWYDGTWPGRQLPCDLVLAEFPLMIPVQFRWAEDAKLLSVDVIPIASC